jgi:catechol 2,3-dioxygenase-like lactoylglutathione lyase family enzyme
MERLKVSDLAYIRLQSPDLDKAEAFLVDFGLVRAERTHDTLYMRGSDSAPFMHVTHLGEPRFLATGWYAPDEDALKLAARLPGASAIASLDEPGGGRHVAFTDPDGYRVEVVHGARNLEPLPVEETRLNFGWDGLRRAGTLQRFPKRPSRVKRIAHYVLTTPDVPRSIAWHREILGLVCSDDIYVGDKANIIGSFNRCDRGAEYVDHHVFFCRTGPVAGLNHVSFEVQDIDDVMLGHDYLVAKGYRHMWGIGRHILGSQIFDFWCDPWGRVHEHWTDSDRLNDAYGSHLLTPQEASGTQWGPRAPKEFLSYATP